MACSAYPKCRNAKSIGGKKKAEGEAAEGEAGEGAAKPKRAPRRRSSAVATDRDCPDCGAKMLIRSGRRGPFLGCSGYPKCRHTENLPADLAVPE
jgi:ssDNA-binding Zn-finger/Zn-ribbon topoisomerase 1